MTRDTDVFIPLEERTAIANREGADLFLSIHANASRNTKARGVETYFLNFASNPEAEAVAARENSASGQDDAQPAGDRPGDRAEQQDRRVARLRRRWCRSRWCAGCRRATTQLRDLGVKQAPFVVLIGAGMPSVLAEISFVTNKQEGALLKTGAYRQQIAEALFDAVLRYQRSLKGVRASRERMSRSAARSHGVAASGIGPRCRALLEPCDRVDAGRDARRDPQRVGRPGSRLYFARGAS